MNVSAAAPIRATILAPTAATYAALLAARFPDMAFLPATNEAEARAAVPECEILIAFGIAMTDDILRAGPKLRWIQSLATGVDKFQTLPSLRPDVMLTSARGIHEAQVSEMAVMLMVALNRQLPRLIESQRAHRWDRFPAPILAGKTAVVWGVGIIGTEIARLCKAFRMTVWGVTRTPREIPHFNRRRSVTVSSNLDDEVLSQGAALEIVERIAKEVLPESGYSYRWTGEAEKFLESGNALAFAYGLAILCVFLVLAAQFESFTHPITILVAVAFSFTGALIALKVTGTTLNLFSKIGLVMLVGLVTKNSILIVEFANQLRGRGMTLVEAVTQSARRRFRPILMTALATMVGILPIALGRGAGGDARAPLGIAVVGGMFFSTILTFFIVPATYVVIERIRSRVMGERSVAQPRAPASAAASAGGS